MVRFDCVVVGAGIHGLCTAFWLRSLGVRSVVVLDQGTPGHTRGSSHGATRITRSSYDVPQFVDLAQRAHREGWPALQSAFGRRLLLPTPGVFFGPPHGPIAGYQRATQAAGVAVEAIDCERARARFPLLRFDGSDLVLLDHTAAMILAANTMASLRQWLRANAVEVAFATRATRLEADDRCVEVATTKSRLQAKTAVLACGAWTHRLSGATAPPLTVLRQEVGYVELAAPEQAGSVGTFPVWCRIGERPNDFTYGLPSHRGRGLKLALHTTTGSGVEPDAEPPPIDDAALLALARARFVPAVRRLAATERCLYTVTSDQRIALGRSECGRILTITACSGHGFKFGPVIGRQAADAVLAAREGRP